jgi:Arc/MetJ-type ribon-helix-helix transcriptional regulator
MSGKDNEVNVAIPRTMYELLQQRIQGTNFESVQDYVKAVLQQALGEDANEGNTQGLSAKDESEIKAKLKALGYM